MIKYIGSIVVALCIGAVLVWVFIPRTVTTEIPVEVEKLVTIEVEAATKKIKDKGGVEHAIISDKENLIKNIEVLDTSSRVYVKEMAEKLSIKEKQFKELQTYTATIESKYAKAIKVSDSTYEHTGNNIKIGFIKSDTASYFKYKYNATVGYAQYTTGGVFNKRQVIDVWIDDPNATISGMRRFKIEPKKDNVGVDISASSMVIKDKAYVGGEAVLRLGKSRISGGYYYDVSRDVWIPIVGYKYNILEL